MKLFSIFILLFLFVSLSCKDSTNSDGANSGNHAPVVQDILVNPPSPINIYTAVDLTAVAVDADGDDLTYLWSSSGGEIFYSTDTNPTNWRSSNAGIYAITCTANDGKSTGSKTINITVN